MKYSSLLLGPEQDGLRPSRPGALGWMVGALMAFFSLAGCATSAPEGLDVVTEFEVDRYLGTWYEIARLDHRFERGLTHVTAQYALKDDGTLSVVNRGFHSEKRRWDQADGKARFQGDSSTGSLEVSFFGPFYGGYHILALDEDALDYRYSLVSGPDRSYLWILARNPQLSQTTLEQLLEQARALGYAIDELIYVPQDNPPDA